MGFLGFFFFLFLFLFFNIYSLCIISALDLNLRSSINTSCPLSLESGLKSDFRFLNLNLGSLVNPSYLLPLEPGIDDDFRVLFV